jgi:hypothetical protein
MLIFNITETDGLSLKKNYNHIEKNPEFEILDFSICFFLCIKIIFFKIIFDIIILKWYKNIKK